MSINTIDINSRIAIPFGPNAVAATDPNLDQPLSPVQFKYIYNSIQQYFNRFSFCSFFFLFSLS